MDSSSALAKDESFPVAADKRAEGDHANVALLVLAYSSNEFSLTKYVK